MGRVGDLAAVAVTARGRACRRRKPAFGAHVTGLVVVGVVVVVDVVDVNVDVGVDGW